VAHNVFGSPEDLSGQRMARRELTHSINLVLRLSLAIDSHRNRPGLFLQLARERQYELETAAFSYFTPQSHDSAMRCDDPLTKRQT
jgi:hypothetical protein